MVDGSGLFVTAPGSTTDVNLLTLGGTTDWLNSGTVGETGTTLTIGDSTFDTATFTNEKGGVYQFTTDSGIALGAALDSSFVNDAGAILEKTGGTGDSIVGVDYSGGGAIAVNTTGTIEFEGPVNIFAAPISGIGQFAVGAGSYDVVAPGVTISTATFGIYDNGTLVTLGEKLNYAGVFNLEDASTVDLAGFVLTLSGTETFTTIGDLGPPTVDGYGTLVTGHGSSTSVNGFLLGGAVDWQNAGTVDELGTLTIGNSSFDAATFTNEKGGIFDLVTDFGIGIGAVSTSAFVNLAGGLLEKTAGTDDSQIFVEFTNNGSVKVETGEIEFEQAVGGAGSFAIAAAAVLRFDASVAKGSSVDFAGTSGGELVLADGPQFAAAIHGFGGTDTIDLRDVNFATVRLGYSGNATEGVLTVTNGTNKAELTMFGNYKLADFHASNDGFNGTLITDPATHALLASAR